MTFRNLVTFSILGTELAASDAIADCGAELSEKYPPRTPQIPLIHPGFPGSLRVSRGMPASAKAEPLQNWIVQEKSERRREKDEHEDTDCCHPGAAAERFFRLR